MELSDYLCKYDVMTMLALGTLRELEERTGFCQENIFLNDLEGMFMFCDEKVFDLPTISEIEAEAILGCGAFEFSNLCRVVGMMNGAGTWENNNDRLSLSKLKLHELISSRDDVFQYLMRMGFEKEDAYYEANTYSWQHYNHG